jgi:hypothetical protein
LVALHPLCQKGRLAVAGRRDDRDHRGLVCGDELIDEGRAGDDSVAELGRIELGFVQLERQPRSGAAILP